MLGRVTADEVIRQWKQSRTKPVLMLCEADTGTPFEVFCKLSAGCFEGVKSLAREVVAACLAVDLELPIPVPYVVEVPAALASTVTDTDIAQLLQASSPVAFGSARVGTQYSAWSRGSRVTPPMLSTALGTFVFDAVIDNTDRRVSNPNCLVAGDRIRLIDHELAFPPTLVGWQPPWRTGSLQWLCKADHIFYRQLRNRSLDFSRVQALWSGISDDRLQEYRNAIPTEWGVALPAVDEALDRVRSARDNLDGVIAEIRRVLQ